MLVQLGGRRTVPCYCIELLLLAATNLFIFSSLRVNNILTNMLLAYIFSSLDLPIYFSLFLIVENESIMTDQKRQLREVQERAKLVGVA